MVKLRVEEILQEQNKTIYWLSKQTSVNANQMALIVRNQTKSINFDTLDKICTALNCDIVDILIRE